MKKIKLFVISYNRLSVLKECIQSYKKFFNNKDIFIIDKGSNYTPLNEYYDQIKNNGINVIYSEPMTAGPEGPGGLNDLYKEIDKHKGDCDYYVVTDPDISIKGCKKDLLSVYISLLEEYPDIDIVGPMLKIDDIPFDYPARELCFHLHVRQFWFRKPTCKLINNNSVYVQKAPIDSTFGMVRSSTKYRRLLRGFRTYFPYEAKHLDWYITPQNITDDQKYYLEKTANSKVSHWSAGLYDKQPSFEKLTGGKRKIYTTRKKWGKIELVFKYLQENVDDHLFCEIVEPSIKSLSRKNIKDLSSADIDNIRDVAILLESINKHLSYDLMSIAHSARPSGSRIKKLLSKYKKQLDH